ncbi:MAG: DUF2179 domain-containing protein [Deltaproteobacteria bacterium]|nr:DUF2179 domain-containing protein [Deltaproteobacteria bacterium]
METLLGAALIFGMRVADVSLGTIRVILSFQGRSVISAAIGFVEVTIYVLAIGRVVGQLDSIINIVAYSGGFAAGTLLGIALENRIALGTRFVRVITHRPNEALVETLRQEGFGVTRVLGEGMQGKVHILLSVVRRKDLGRFINTVQDMAPKAFFTVEDARAFQGGFVGRRKTK